MLNYFSFFNVQGLNPLTKPSKVPYVKDLLLENNKIFIGLTETWLRDHFDGELQIEGYTLFRCDRRMTRSKYGRDSGGTAFFIKEEIASLFEPVIEYSDGVIEMLGLFSKKNNSLLVVLYRTPDRPIRRSTSKEFRRALKKLSDEIYQLSINNTVPGIVLGGDFNLPHVNWKMNCVNPGAKSDELSMIKLLEDFGNEHFLVQHVDIPTHLEGNTLDLILTNNYSWIHSVRGIEPLPSLSHHKIVIVATEVNLLNTNKHRAETTNYISPFDELKFP